MSIFADYLKARVKSKKHSLAIIDIFFLLRMQKKRILLSSIFRSELGLKKKLTGQPTKVSRKGSACLPPHGFLQTHGRIVRRRALKLSHVVE